MSAIKVQLSKQGFYFWKSEEEEEEAAKIFIIYTTIGPFLTAIHLNVGHTHARTLRGGRFARETLFETILFSGF